MIQKPTLLFVGIYAPGYSSDAMVKSFESLGFDVKIIDWQRVRFSNGTKALQDTILNTALCVSPELIFMHIQNPEAVSADIFKKLNNIAPVINYTFDVREDISWYKEIAPLISLTCFACERDVLLCEAEGIENVMRSHSACDMDRYKPLQLPKAKRDQYPEFVFIGNDLTGANVNFPKAQHRKDMVAFMEKHFGKRFKAYGMGFGEIVLQQEEALIYNSCKVAITHNHFNLAGYCSDRGFRSMACGCFTLNEYYEGIREDFQRPYTWKDLTHLGDYCEIALNNKGLRQSVKYSNYCDMLDRHTWKHRFDSMLQKIKVLN